MRPTTVRRPTNSSASGDPGPPSIYNQPRPLPTIDYTNRSNPVNARNAAFIANPQYADMHFFIELEDVEIVAHRVIVSAASPVFEKFLAGTGTLPATNRITVSECSVERFRQVLRYIYTDDASIDEDNALDILRVANYFALADLEDKCAETLLRQVTIYNVCEMFSRCWQVSSRLSDKCMQLIQSKTNWLLESGELFGMEPDAFSEILKLDVLNVRTEREIFAGLLKWADERCRAEGVAGSAKNRRQMIGAKRLGLVRFTTMELPEFLSCLQLEPAFFSSSEVAAISAAIRAVEPPFGVGDELQQLQLHSSVVRQIVLPEIKVSQLFHWCSRGSNYRNFPPEQFSLRAVAPVLVYGIGMYGRTGLQIQDAKRRTLRTREIVYDEGSEMSKLWFATPFVVKPDEQHHTFTALHDPQYGKFFYFFQMEYKERRNVFFGYNFSTAYTNKYIRVVEIYYEDLLST